MSLGPYGTPERQVIEERLRQEMTEARRKFEEAKAVFDIAVKDAQNIGLAHLDGATAARIAIRDYNAALKEYSQALKRFTDFSLGKADV